MNRTNLAMGLIAAALVATTLSSCGLRLYRLPVQQGNVITQEMVDALKPGMTREQVAYVMGEPVVKNPFDEDRWDYVYTMHVRGRIDERKKMSLFFENDALSHFTGDFKPSDDADATEAGAEPDQRWE